MPDVDDRQLRRRICARGLSGAVGACLISRGRRRLSGHRVGGRTRLDGVEPRSILSQAPVRGELVRHAVEPGGIDAESFAAEKNTGAADSAYAALVTRYPSSPRAAQALYKRARIKQSAGRTSEARTLYQELVRKYPKSDEAVLACGAMPSAVMI